MRVLVTRPEPDAARVRDRLRRAGHDVIVAPMMKIRFTDAKLPDLGQLQAVLLTSANGARAFARQTGRRDVTVFAVGDATANTLRTAGFENIHTAGGDAETLATLVIETLAPDDGPVLHVAGSVVAGDLQGVLEQAGFDVGRIVAYEAEAEGQLPPSLCQALQAGNIDCALFYSPRTARIFVDLIHAAGFEPAVSSLVAGCLSNAVRDALQSLAWRRIVIAESPTEDALMAALGLDRHGPETSEHT